MSTYSCPMTFSNAGNWTFQKHLVWLRCVRYVTSTDIDWEFEFFKNESLQIGEHLVVDPSFEEEACSTGSIVVAVSQDGLITGIFKIGEGSFHQISVCEAVKVEYIINMALEKIRYFVSIDYLFIHVLMQFL